MGAETKPATVRGRKTPITRRSIIVMMVTPAMAKATCLDREADLALALGQHVRAERLAWRAAELRGVAG